MFFFPLFSHFFACIFIFLLADWKTIAFDSFYTRLYSREEVQKSCMCYKTKPFHTCIGKSSIRASDSDRFHDFAVLFVIVFNYFFNYFCPLLEPNQRFQMTDWSVTLIYHSSVVIVFCCIFLCFSFFIDCLTTWMKKMKKKMQTWWVLIMVS